jgi:hypothetical protein
VHQYLRAIGFSKINKDELKAIFQNIVKYPTIEKTATDSEGNEFVEISKEFGTHIGITLRGTYKTDETFEMEYYYPYFVGESLSSEEMIDVQKHAEKESYAGVCDEVKLGVAMIFYLQNVADYLAYTALDKNRPQGVVLAGLSTEGKVILPISKTERQSEVMQNISDERNHLIAAAREGDEDAIENLTLEDIDMYAVLSRRIKHEDILSIVESSFLPCGVECDQYSVIGEIRDVKLISNSFTGENIYLMDIECNEMTFGVCINQSDLLGQPAVGRRFKGMVWMQGTVRF